MAIEPIFSLPFENARIEITNRRLTNSYMTKQIYINRTLIHEADVRRGNRIDSVFRFPGTSCKVKTDKMNELFIK